jgi:O-antigen ligase
MAIDYAFVALILLAVMSWGANRLIFMALFPAVLLLLLIIKILWSLRRGRFSLQYTPVFLPLAIFFAVVALQYLLPATSLDNASAFWPHTVEPHTTRTYFLLLAGYFSIFVCTVNGFGTRRRISVLMLVIVIFGVFEALYGFLQRFGDFQYVWIVPIQSGRSQGTLMNHNHYAFLLNICICTGVGLLYCQAAELFRRERMSLRSILSAPESPRLLWMLIWIGFMGFGVIASLSRMGTFALLVSLGFMFLTIRLAEKRRYAAFLIFGVLLAVVSLGLYAGIDAAYERYVELTRTGQLDASRIKLWSDAWPLVKKASLFGMGVGSFQWVFPAVESVDPDIPAMYAHNDYIQIVVEMGVVGLALAVWAFVLSWRSAMSNLRAKDSLVRGIGLATIGVLVVTAIQEITDFSLYIPGLAALFVLLIGLNERASQLEKASFSMQH